MKRKFSVKIKFSLLFGAKNLANGQIRASLIVGYYYYVTAAEPTSASSSLQDFGPIITYKDVRPARGKRLLLDLSARNDAWKNEYLLLSKTCTTHKNPASNEL